MSTGSRVVVQVPATSANLGPGFDALGLALDIREELHLWVLAEGGSPEIRVSGVNAGIFPEDETLLAYRSAVAVFDRIGMQAPPIGLELVTRIPSSGGLGGSAAAIVAGVVAANALAGKPLNRAGELSLVAEIEGHPDNVSAALLGGLVVCVAGRDGLVTSRLPVESDLRAVVCLPDEAISTKSARGVIPRDFPIGDAVFNLGRTALLVAAFANKDWGLLRDAMDDRIHQPARGGIFPALHPTIEAALAAGAHGAALSGAGAAIIALATGHFKEIATAMHEAAARHGYPNQTLELGLTNRGAEVITGYRADATVASAVRSRSSVNDAL